MTVEVVHHLKKIGNLWISLSNKMIIFVVSFGPENSKSCVRFVSNTNAKGAISFRFGHNFVSFRIKYKLRFVSALSKTEFSHNVDGTVPNNLTFRKERV